MDLKALWERLTIMLHMPEFQFHFADLVEILLISFLFYNILIWIKNTRAWNLLKGLVLILFIVGIAFAFQMTTILWIARNAFSVGIIALVIIFQPELRKALENLGQKKFFWGFFSFGRAAEPKITDHVIDELVRATFAMSRVKTGALIVIESEIALNEYVRTGIDIDALISSQLLINIFEKNTPLHDGAVIIKGDRVVSATCYLPLSDSPKLSKELGTRHRAAVGISEVSDSMTVVVSEETGTVSVALHGVLTHCKDGDELRKALSVLKGGKPENSRFKKRQRRGPNGQEDTGDTDQ